MTQETDNVVSKHLLFECLPQYSPGKAVVNRKSMDGTSYLKQDLEEKSMSVLNLLGHFYQLPTE